MTIWLNGKIKHLKPVFNVGSKSDWFFPSILFRGPPSEVQIPRSFAYRKHEGQDIAFVPLKALPSLQVLKRET